MQLVSPCLELHVATIRGNDNEAAPVEGLALVVLEALHRHGITVIHANDATTLHLEEHLVLGTRTEVAIAIHHLYGDEGKVVAIGIGAEVSAVGCKAQCSGSSGGADDLLCHHASVLASHCLHLAGLKRHPPHQVILMRVLL